MTALLRRLGDGLAALAGAHAETLAAAPSTRARFVALGGVLLSTGRLALLSAAFAVHMALGAPWALALLVGLGWAVVIINLDRMLLVGMAHDASMRRNLALAVPRVGLGLVLGVVIATPLTLHVFHKEIETEIVTLQAEAADAYKRALDEDARFVGLPALRQQVAEQQAIVASGGQTDPALATLQATVTAEQAAFDEAVTTAQRLSAKAQCELDGTCGTGRPGDGDAYRSAKAAASAQAGVVSAAKVRLDAAVAAVEAAEARSAGQAQGDLATDEAMLASLTAEQTRLQAAFEAENSDDGILIRLEALNRLGDRNATLWTAHFMLSLLFICIELLPVLMKVLLNFGPPSAYDRLTAIRDRSDIAVQELQQEARREVEEAQSELLVMAEKDRVERQKEALIARRRAHDARLAARMEAEAQNAVAEEPGRRAWDTGPIRGLARTAAARTVRSVARRASERIPTGV